MCVYCTSKTHVENNDCFPANCGIPPNAHTIYRLNNNPYIIVTTPKDFLYFVK